MSDLKLDENLQPVFTDVGDYEKVEKEAKAHQIIRLSSQDRMFNIFSKYRREDIENKIRTEINRIAQEKSFINSVQDISVDKVRSEKSAGSGYKVKIRYNQSENYTEIINQL